MRVETAYKLPDGFKTSINVLNKVLNIPCSTVEHELKKHNYSFYRQSSNCIDERMLDIFAERFFPKPALEKIGFSPSGDFYLGFEIKDFKPIPGIDPDSYELERKHKQASTPYFTTIDKFLPK